MKQKIKIIPPLVIASVFIISVVGAAAVSHTGEMDMIQQEPTAPLKPYAPTPKGEIWFGIISIRTTTVEGSVPEEDYAGILIDVNVTLQGTTRTSAVPIPFMFLASSFHTTETVYLQMEFFWGVVHTTSDRTTIDGFARMVTWEW